MNTEILIILGLGGLVYFFVLGMFAVLKKWSDENDNDDDPSGESAMGPGH